MKWKSLAILLGILLIVENLAFGYILYVGISIGKQETECSINVCADAEYYSYDSYEEICYCYEGEEIIKTEFIG